MHEVNDVMLLLAVAYYLPEKVLKSPLFRSIIRLHHWKLVPFSFYYFVTSIDLLIVHIYVKIIGIL